MAPKEIGISAIIRRNLEGRSEYSQLNPNLIFCQPCGKNINVDRKHISYQIKAHDNTKKHKQNYESWRARRLVQSSLGECIREQKSPFFYDFAKFMVSCNIPWDKLNHPMCRSFIKKYTGHTAPDESTLRKNYLPQLYAETIENIRNSIRDNWIYLQVDESADSKNRPVVSILVGSLNGEKPISFLLDIVYLDGSTDSVKIYQTINESLKILWPEMFYYDRVRLLTSDQASYMLKAGRQMKKNVFPKMLHVTCLAHACHRVAELARTKNNLVNDLVSDMKKIFIKCERRRNAFNLHSGKALPRFPIKTRWGSWLNFTLFVCDNFDVFKSFIDTLPNESEAIKHVKTIINDKRLLNELLSLKSLAPISETITRLEAIGLDIYEQRELINKLKTKLPAEYRNKLQSSLDANPDYDSIFEMSSLEEKERYSFAPLASCDVERSFSRLRTIFTDLRQSFTEKNFRDYAVVNYNNSKLQ